MQGNRHPLIYLIENIFQCSFVYFVCDKLAFLKYCIDIHNNLSDLMYFEGHLPLPTFSEGEILYNNFSQYHLTPPPHSPHCPDKLQMEQVIVDKFLSLFIHPSLNKTCYGAVCAFVQLAGSLRSCIFTVTDACIVFKFGDNFSLKKC